MAVRPYTLMFPFLIFLFALTLWKFHNYSLVMDDWLLLSSRTWNSVLGAFAGHPTTQAAFYYRPFAELLFYLSDRIIGDNVPWQYVLSVGMVFLISFILYRILLAFAANKRVALMSALTFLATPFAAYGYSWIANRFELDYILFYLLAYLLFVLYFFGKSRNPVVIVLSLVSFGLSLMSKEQSILLPFVILLTVVVYTNKSKIIDLTALKKHVWVLAPYFFVLTIYVVFVRVLILGNVFGGDSVYYGAPIYVQLAAVAFQYFKAVIFSFFPYPMFFSVGTLLLWLVLILLNIYLFWKLFMRNGANLEQKKHIVFMLAFILITAVPLAKSPSVRLLLLESVPVPILIACNIYALSEKISWKTNIYVLILVAVVMGSMTLLSSHVQDVFAPGAQLVAEKNVDLYDTAGLADSIKLRMETLYFDRFPEYISLTNGQWHYSPKFGYSFIENLSIDNFIESKLKNMGLIK